VSDKFQALTDLPPWKKSRYHYISGWTTELLWTYSSRESKSNPACTTGSL